MSNLPQHIKDRIEQEAMDYAERVPYCWPQIPYRTAATTWVERGQKLAYNVAQISAFKAGAAEYFMQHNYRELYGLLTRIFEISDASLIEWNQSINKEEQA